jgi:hypothetical protein
MTSSRTGLSEDVPLKLLLNNDKGTCSVKRPCEASISQAEVEETENGP